MIRLILCSVSLTLCSASASQPLPHNRFPSYSSVHYITIYYIAQHDTTSILSIKYMAQGGHPRAAQQQLRLSQSGGFLRQDHFCYLSFCRRLCFPFEVSTYVKGGPVGIHATLYTLRKCALDPTSPHRTLRAGTGLPSAVSIAAVPP